MCGRNQVEPVQLWTKPLSDGSVAVALGGAATRHAPLHISLVFIHTKQTGGRRNHLATVRLGGRAAFQRGERHAARQLHRARDRTGAARRVRAVREDGGDERVGRHSARSLGRGRLAWHRTPRLRRVCVQVRCLNV